MASKVVRLDEDLVSTVQSFSPTGSLSEALRVMIAIQNPRPPASTLGVSFAVPEMVGGMPDAYWKQLRKELDRSIENAKREY